MEVKLISSSFQFERVPFSLYTLFFKHVTKYTRKVRVSEHPTTEMNNHGRLHLAKGTLFFIYEKWFVSDEGWQLFAIFLFLSLYEFLMKSCWQLWKAKPIFYYCWVKKFLLSLNFYKSIQPWLSIMQWEWASAVAEKINDWEMTAREAWKRKKARGEGRGKTFLCTWLTTGWKVNDEKRSKMMMIKWH